MPIRLNIAWCQETDDPAQLAAFFVHNLHEEYISHSELQFGRAMTITEWNPCLQSIIAKEVSLRLCGPHPSCLRIAQARFGTELVGLSYITFNPDVPIPYIIIEDIIISASRRSEGIGTELVEWVLADALNKGFKRAFLESGLNNHRAHSFFSRFGFNSVSTVMMSELS